MMGWTASSSTFFYVGSMEVTTLTLGAADRVGFFSNSKSISAESIYWLIGAWLALGLIVCSASTFLS